MRGTEESYQPEQSIQHVSQSRRNAIAIMLLLAATATAMFALFKLASTDSYEGPVSVINITGTSVCLPHKDSGPTALECAIGIKGDDGRYYALSGATPQTDFGERVSVRGVLASPEPNEKYSIAGTITVQSSSPQ